MELHPLCTFFPRIEGAEFELLKADIAKNGQEEPIVTLDGMVLDGGNRFRACQALGIEPVTREYGGNDPAQYVLTKNLYRRNLTAGQRSVIVSLTTNWSDAAQHGGDRRSTQVATLPLASKNTISTRAARSEVSERTQRTADQVLKKSPELAQKVATGELTLPEAAKQVDIRPVSKKTANDIEKLKAENGQLREQLTLALDNVDDLKDELRNLIAFSTGEEAKRMRDLATNLKTVESSRDVLLRENAALKKEIKRLNRRLGEKL